MWPRPSARWPGRWWSAGVRGPPGGGAGGGAVYDRLRLGPPVPGTRRGADALDAVAAAAHAAITGHGFGSADLWPLLGRSAWPGTSSAARASVWRAARAPPCPEPGRDTRHDHHGVTGAAHRDTVSAAPSP